MSAFPFFDRSAERLVEYGVSQFDAWPLSLPEAWRNSKSVLFRIHFDIDRADGAREVSIASLDNLIPLVGWNVRDWLIDQAYSLGASSLSTPVPYVDRELARGVHTKNAPEVPRYAPDY